MNSTFRFCVPAEEKAYKHTMGSRLTKTIRPDQVILVPTDFSQVTESALVHGLELARSLQCSVCLLHVYTAPAGTIYNKEDPACQEIVQKLKECQERYSSKYSVAIDPMVREGNLFKVFNAVVAEIKPRLMVMGTHGKQGLQQIFGSHALRVVLDAPCPVMVVQAPPAEHGYRRILLPLNSEVDLAQLLGWVMHCCTANAELHLYQSMEIIPDRAKLTEGITARIISGLKEKKIPYSLSVAGSSSDFSSQVVDYAIANASDLVMTMTMPAAGATGYNFTDWNERLMFNSENIPVMFIDQSDTHA
jgi:nucleotide-binding universal stress UspA family protein